MADISELLSDRIEELEGAERAVASEAYTHVFGHILNPELFEIDFDSQGESSITGTESREQYVVRKVREHYMRFDALWMTREYQGMSKVFIDIMRDMRQMAVDGLSAAENGPPSR
jgi:hypothetical protein